MTDSQKRVFRLDLSYDGSEFLGFQKQKTGKTIQGEVDKALKKIFKQPVVTWGAGRTDAGVHALHQVMSFSLATPIPLKGLKRALNTLLPPAIRVLEVSEAHPAFHARFSPKRRTYLYLIYNHEFCPPFLYRHVFWIRRKLNLKKMRQALNFLKGEHDFEAFCEKEEKKLSYVRKIYSIQLKKKNRFVMIQIQGNGFLRRMVRVIVGTAVAIGSYDQVPPAMMKEILDSRQRTKNPFATAPAEGLYLYRVNFEKSRKIYTFFRKVFLPLQKLLKL